MAAIDGCTKTISEMFDEGFAMFNGLSKNYEPTNSLFIQCLIKKCMHLLEETTKLVSLAGLFSTNETIQEVSTNEVKFMLLPALLGTLTLKLCISDRLEVIATAEVYFKDFLERCRNYGIIDFNIPNFEMPNPTLHDQGAINNAEGSASAPLYNMAEMACTRNKKIQRFKEEKDMMNQISDLQAQMNDCNTDDETKRAYYLTLIKYFTSQALDELDCLYTEKGYLLTKPKQEEAESLPQKRQHRPRTPISPVTISARKEGSNEDSC